MTTFDSVVISSILNVEKDKKDYDWVCTRAEQKIRGVPVIIYKKTDGIRILTGKPEHGMEDVTEAEVMHQLGKKFGAGKGLEPFDFGSTSGARNRWIFEYTRPNLLTPHYDTDMVLLACIIGGVGRETSPEMLNKFAKEHGFKRPWYKYTANEAGVEDILKNDISPLDEGVIVINSMRRRIEFPNPVNAILRKFILDGSATLSDASKLSLAGSDVTEIITKFYPKMKGILDITDKGLSTILTSVNNHMAAYSHIENRIEFCQASASINAIRLVHALYNRRINSFHEAMDCIKPEEVLSAAFKNSSPMDVQASLAKALGKSPKEVKIDKELIV